MTSQPPYLIIAVACLLVLAAAVLALYLRPRWSSWLRNVIWGASGGLVVGLVMWIVSLFTDDEPDEPAIKPDLDAITHDPAGPDIAAELADAEADIDTELPHATDPTDYPDDDPDALDTLDTWGERIDT